MLYHILCFLTSYIFACLVFSTMTLLTFGNVVYWSIQYCYAFEYIFIVRIGKILNSHCWSSLCIVIASRIKLLGADSQKVYCSRNGVQFGVIVICNELRNIENLAELPASCEQLNQVTICTA